MLDKHRLGYDLVLIVLLCIASLYAWRLLPTTIIHRDGFVHMLDSEQKRFWGPGFDISDLTPIEVGATLVGAILPFLFGPNISSYLWFELAIVLLIAVLFYIFVRIVTGSFIIAFVSSLIASVSYFGNWDIYGPHCYCFFLERVINFPFMLTALIFLHLYLLRGKKILYILSLFLYIVGIALGHLELLFTPAFFFHPLWQSFFVTPRKSWIKGLIIGTTYVMISAFFTIIQQVRYGGWGPPLSFVELVRQFKIHNFITPIILQLVHLSQYGGVLQKTLSLNPLDQIAIESTTPLSFGLIVALYIACFAILYHALPKFKGLLLSCLSIVVSRFFLNTYMRYDEIVQADSNRYLYFPMFFLSIFWGIAFWFFFFKKGSIRRLIGIALLIGFYMINVNMINYAFSVVLRQTKTARSLLRYIVNQKNSYQPKTVIIIPSPELGVQEAEFFTKTLGQKNIYVSETQMSTDINLITSSAQNILKLQYDTSCGCVKETRIK